MIEKGIKMSKNTVTVLLGNRNYRLPNVNDDRKIRTVEVLKNKFENFNWRKNWVMQMARRGWNVLAVN